SFDQGWGHRYSPKNFNGRYLGEITAREALVLSRNVCAIRVAQAVGVDKVIATARACGISSPLDSNITIALGSGAVSPLELATAYGTLARYGSYLPPRLIRSILDDDGHELWSNAVSARQTVPQDQVTQLVDVLQDVVQRGTGTQAKLEGVPVA